jgi:hypothetical protein
VPGDVSATTGTVVATGTGFGVNIGGAVNPVLFPAGYIPTAGDVVTVLRIGDRMYVHGPVSSAPRPITGTVAGAPSGGRIPVDVTVGPSPIQCRYSGTPPATGSLVFLDWQATTPRIMSSNAAEPEPAPAEPPPAETPPPPRQTTQTGTDRFAAVDSGTFQVGSDWDYWRKDVVQWRYGSNRENRGAWFYGVAPTRLKGRTIPLASIRLPARKRIGSYNDALTAHLYLISNPHRPGGDTNRIAGPHDIVIPAGFGGGWFSIPASWGQTLANSGGGIAIVGEPYLGFEGIEDDTASGQVALDWSRPV